MSNIFTKSNLGLKIQGLDSESSIDLHTFLQSSDKKGGSTKFSMTDDTSSFMPQKDGSTKLSMTDDTSSFMPQKGGTKFAMTDETSSFMPQKGGSSNKTSNDQVEQLISMLTSETEDKHNTATNSTSTSELEIKLRNVLQKGGFETEYDRLRNNVDEAKKNVKELEEKILIQITKIRVPERAAMTRDKIQEHDKNRNKLTAELDTANIILKKAEDELNNYNIDLKIKNDKVGAAVKEIGLWSTMEVAGKTVSDLVFGKASPPAPKSPQSPQTTGTTGTTTTTIRAT